MFGIEFMMEVIGQINIHASLMIKLFICNNDY